MWNSGRPKSKKKQAPSIDEATAEKLFQEIADEDDPHVASMEGISKLCDQLELDPLEDIRILVLLWKLGANDKPAQINKEEWMQGCNKLQVDTVDKFKALLPSLDTGFLEQAEFKDFYKVRRVQYSTRAVGMVVMQRKGSHRLQYISISISISISSLTLEPFRCCYCYFDAHSFVFSSTDKAHIELWIRKWSWRS
jgi:hypothetical protein